MKQMLKKFFTAQAQHHTEMAKAHQSSGADYEDGCSESVFHKAATQSHLAAGESAVECCQACAKADASDFGKSEGMDFDAVIPTQISAVAPERGGNLRMVLRTGAKDYSAATHAPATPFDFSKLHAVEE